ncbi:MAG: hypothetical protein B7Z80_02060 [Rhodospirillales bacterium 20-64-7]|nr:MAG: hypothetical protein B7Z80_02060 [Rhodospirillales bacterium 20-64-7]
MTVEEIVAAFALPAGAIRPTRIPKTVLNERGAVTAADRKLVDATIDRLDWVATLSPASVGVVAGDGVAAIQVMTLTVRAAPTQRLLTLIHRAVPLPIVLITALEEGVRVSLAPLRKAERMENEMVVERLIVGPEIGALTPAAASFLASLAVPGLSRVSLDRVYEGLVWRVEALVAAEISGASFRLPVDADDAVARRNALARHDAVAVEWSRARNAARSEKNLSRQVALAEAARVVKTRFDAAILALA